MAGIYIHIPFCKQRCIYCDFYSSTQKEKEADYIDAVCQELVLRKDSVKEDIRTLYIGGGTPSLLSVGLVKKIADTINSHYSRLDLEEFTIEANPDDITDTWLDEIKRAGINRISIGIQTFHNDKLKLLNRRHDRNKAVEAVKRCQKHGFHNISIDLIYGLPGETLQKWEEDLKEAVALGVTHISAYALIYEENTLLWKFRESGKIEEVPEEVSLAMFEMLIQKLKEAGMEHYEISNFAQPGFMSRHNSSYWQDIPYLGCGASAHSYIDGKRMYNPAHIQQYIQNIRNCAENGIPYEEVCHVEELNRYERYNDRIITSLRTAAGLDLLRLEKDFGKDLKEYCMRMAAPHIQANTLQTVPIMKDGNCLQGVLKLTPQGIFLSDDIMSDLLWVD